MNPLQDIPSKVYSRLHEIYEKSQLDTTPKMYIKFDSRRSSILFNNYSLTFGQYGSDKLWVRVESLTENSIYSSDLETALKSPEKFSRSARPSEYLKMVQRGKSKELVPGRNVEIEYRLTGATKNPNEIFEAFWFLLNPVIKSIKK